MIFEPIEFRPADTRTAGEYNSVGLGVAVEPPVEVTDVKKKFRFFFVHDPDIKSQRALADAIGKSASTVNEYVNGKGGLPPSIPSSIVDKVAGVMEVTREELLGPLAEFETAIRRRWVEDAGYGRPTSLIYVSYNELDVDAAEQFEKALLRWGFFDISLNADRAIEPGADMDRQAERFRAIRDCLVLLVVAADRGVGWDQGLEAGAARALGKRTEVARLTSPGSDVWIPLYLEGLRPYQVGSTINEATLHGSRLLRRLHDLTAPRAAREGLRALSDLTGKALSNRGAPELTEEGIGALKEWQDRADTVLMRGGGRRESRENRSNVEDVHKARTVAKATIALARWAVLSEILRSREYTTEFIDLLRRTIHKGYIDELDQITQALRSLSVSETIILREFCLAGFRRTRPTIRRSRV